MTVRPSGWRNNNNRWEGGKCRDDWFFPPFVFIRSNQVQRRPQRPRRTRINWSSGSDRLEVFKFNYPRRWVALRVFVNAPHSDPRHVPLIWWNYGSWHRNWTNIWRPSELPRSVEWKMISKNGSKTINRAIHLCFATFSHKSTGDD